MPEHHLTLGAHLLLWAFPLLIVVIAVVDALLGLRRPEPEP